VTALATFCEAVNLEGPDIFVLYPFRREMERHPWSWPKHPEATKRADATGPSRASGSAAGQAPPHAAHTPRKRRRCGSACPQGQSPCAASRATRQGGGNLWHSKQFPSPGGRGKGRGILTNHGNSSMGQVTRSHHSIIPLLHYSIVPMFQWRSDPSSAVALLRRVKAKLYSATAPGMS
jgi:hypothetical protein